MSIRENYNIYAYPFLYANQSLRINSYGPYEFVLPSDDLYWETHDNIAQNEFSKNVTHYQIKVQSYFIDGSTNEPIANQSLLWVYSQYMGVLAYANHYSFVYNDNAWYNIEIRYIGTSHNTDTDNSDNQSALPFTNLIFLNLVLLLIVRVQRAKKKAVDSIE